MSSFRDLQKVYEEGYTGMAVDHSPNNKYGPMPSKHSYRAGIPFNAGGSDNEYARMALNTGVAIADDEEHEHDTEGSIGKAKILEKIKELAQVANQDEMMYAVHLLGQLKEFIKSN